MIFRILFFLGLYSCVSQNDLIYDVSENDSTDLETLFFLEISNMGDPVLWLTPKFISLNNSLYHSSQNVRNIDFSPKFNINHNNHTVSHVHYDNCYSDGGFLQSFLSRPIGKTSLFNFSYNNLSSKGFYVNQLNRFSNLSVSFDFFSDRYPYSNSIFFSSINADYQSNGGLVDYDPNVSPELLETFLNFATTNIKKREFLFLQDYLFHKDLKLQHKLYMLKFQRGYADSSPFSFYYSLTPLSYSILDYNINTFFSTIDNTLSLLRNNLEFSINHIYYNNNELNKNKINGDIFVSIQSNQAIQKKINFTLSYCPLGYSKKNHLLNIDFNQPSDNITHYFSLNFIAKKPNFFREHYDNSMLWDWNDLLSINQLSVTASSIIHKNNITSVLYMNRSVNYFYFNDLAHPVQLLDPLLYFKIQVKKEFKFNHFSFNSLMCFQYSNNEVLSVPLFLFNQEIVYTKSLLNDVNLSTTLSGLLFSKYYPDSFFPLTDVFYQQRNVKNRVVPFFSGKIYVSKDQFSIGCIFDHLSNLFVNNNFIVPLHILPEPVIRLSVKWNFLD